MQVTSSRAWMATQTAQQTCKPVSGPKRRGLRTPFPFTLPTRKQAQGVRGSTKFTQKDSVRPVQVSNSGVRLTSWSWHGLCRFEKRKQESKRRTDGLSAQFCQVPVLNDQRRATRVF